MPSVQTDRARQLRRSMTEAERRLWRRLRARGMGSVKFRRQHPVGPYIVDFCCAERMVVVEIELRVLRFWNNEVMGNIEGVLQRIAEAVGGGPPHPHPLPQRGRG